MGPPPWAVPHATSQRDSGAVQTADLGDRERLHTLATGLGFTAAVERW